MAYHATLGGETYRFTSLADLMAKATPERSGDQLAGIAADSARQRVAAREALADLPWPLSCSRQWCPTRPTRSPG